MKDALRAQFKDMQELHTPRVDFVRDLEARLADAPVKQAVSEHFPAQLSRAFNTFITSLVPARLAPVAQRLSTLLLVFGIAVGGWIGAVSASYNSVPGEALYNVKLATERVQLAAVEATGDKTKTAKLHSSFAERRANEVKRVIEKNKEPEQAQAAMALLTKSVNDANTAIKEAQADPETSEAALETTEELLADNERIAASLREVLDTLPSNVSALIDDIVVLHGDLTDKRLTTLQDIVRKQLDGTSNLSEEQTREIVVRALKQISDTTNESVALAKELEETAVAQEEAAAVAVADEATEVTTTQAVAETSTPSTISSTLASTTTAVSEATSTPVIAKELVKLSDIDGISADVQAEIESVESLVNEGNLLEALEKAKEINTKQVEIEQAIKKVVLEHETTIADAEEVESTTESPTDAATTTDATTTIGTQITTTTTIQNQTSSTTQ
jgi:hypothetical protein